MVLFTNGGRWCRKMRFSGWWGARTTNAVVDALEMGREHQVI